MISHDWGSLDASRNVSGSVRPSLLTYLLEFVPLLAGAQADSEGYLIGGFVLVRVTFPKIVEEVIVS